MTSATGICNRVRFSTAASAAWRPAHGSNQNKPCSANINIDERAGIVSVRDPRVFHPDHRGLCQQILAQVVNHAAVCFAVIDLTTNTCAVQFHHGQSAWAMAEAFAGAIRAALAPAPVGRDQGRAWESMTVFRDNGILSSWESRLLATGRLELRAFEVGDDRFELPVVANCLVQLAGVTSCRVDRWPRRLMIDFDPTTVNPHRLHACAHSAGLDQHRINAVQPGPRTGQFLVPPGMRRAGYWALAGGSFTLTLAGIIVPGIPTVPFLLMTGYALGRCSPRLHGILGRTRFFGPILKEWEAQRGMSQGAKNKAFAMKTSVLALCVALDPFDPIALGLTAVFTSFFYCSFSIPRKAEQSDSAEDEPALPVVCAATGSGSGSNPEIFEKKRNLEFSGYHSELPDV